MGLARCYLLIALVTAGFLTACGVLAGTVETCDQYKPVTVGSYIVQTDYWNKANCPGEQCLSVDDRTGAFTVTKGSYGCNNPYIVATYPSIVYGYAFGTRTPKCDLPAQIATLKHVFTSWDFQPTHTGRWDAAYDIWLCPGDHCGPDGFSGGLEVMVWLDYSDTNGWKTDLGPVTLGGKAWETWYCGSGESGSKWGYVAYLAKEKVKSVKDLDLKAFLDDCAVRGYSKPSWYLSAVEAGNEIHSGGVPFTSKSFSVSVVRMDGTAAAQTPDGKGPAKGEEVRVLPGGKVGL